MNSRLLSSHEKEEQGSSHDQFDVSEPVIPDDFICPISAQMFLDPVKVPLDLKTSVTIERQVIERCIKDTGKIHIHVSH